MTRRFGSILAAAALVWGVGGSASAHRSHVLSCSGSPGELERTEWMTMFSVTDPDGHELTFAETNPDEHSIDPW
ncbi:MAG: hypothetical protein MJE66_23940 [Proteobacteria bacterium]|nr:hypothetical protein [Pseudomonadota bacterium]